ncbi:hypothetical protein E2320_001438, partial [Naja naja]
TAEARPPQSRPPGSLPTTPFQQPNSLPPPGPPSPGEEEGEEEEAAGEAGEAESRAHLGEVQHPQLVEPLLGSHRGARSPRQARPPRSVALTPAGQRCRPPLLHASAPDWLRCAWSCWPASLAPPPPPPDSQPGRAPGRRSGRSAGAPLGRPAAPPAFTRPSSDGEVALRAAMRSTLGWPPLASSIGDSARSEQAGTRVPPTCVRNRPEDGDRGRRFGGRDGAAKGEAEDAERTYRGGQEGKAGRELPRRVGKRLWRLARSEEEGPKRELARL